VIFVTVGTHHQPFERLLSALSALNRGELVVQYGPGEPPPGVARAKPYMPFDEVQRNLREADAVITHAGVGSILCATREGHTPLVVPRRHDLGEHVDDHQAELTRALEGRGGVIAVWDVEQLVELVKSAPPRQLGGQRPEPPLCGSVRAALLGDSPQASVA
jgi:UDP-N-acetylglucosamine--N-acetylmuramyl-(pentapeptide) pyrophosphoryl-undecaprenol N-acetylglucosamine transferase